MSYSTVDFKIGRFISGTDIVTRALKSRRGNQSDSKHVEDSMCSCYLKVEGDVRKNGVALRSYERLPADSQKRNGGLSSTSARNWIPTA